jgi:hypothetical protein
VAKWSDIITLIAEKPPAGEQTNENGFDFDTIEQSRSVFCNKKSVGHAEFYASHQAGVKAELKIDIHTQDYAGEEIAAFGGKRYKILRTYETRNGEFTELTLTDLPERGMQS